MSKWNFGKSFNKKSYKPDSDWSSQEDSGLAMQPDHYPNIARPGGGFPEGKGEESDVLCKTCNQNNLIDGACPLCDWGRSNTATPGGNYPQDPYGTEMVHFRSKVGGSWDFGQGNDYWDMGVERGEIPVPNSETKPQNYQRPRQDWENTPKEEDPEGFEAPDPQWQQDLLRIHPEIAGMSEAEIADYFGKTKIKKLLDVPAITRWRNREDWEAGKWDFKESAEIKLEDHDGPIDRSSYGPDDWHYRYDPYIKKYWVEWPAKNMSTRPLSKEELETVIAQLRAQDSEREGQMALQFEASTHWGGFDKNSDVEGYSNWETFNTAAMMENEQATHEYSTELVRQGGTPKDLANWALITIVGPYNQKALQDAQTWNEVPYEERPTGKEDMGEGLKDLTNKFDEMFGWDNRADSVAETINESFINWDEIHNDIMGNIKEDEEWNHNDGGHREGDPTRHPLCPVCNPENTDSPGDTTIPEDWTF